MKKVFDVAKAVRKLDEGLFIMSLVDLVYENVLYSLVGVMAGFALAGLLLFISRAPAGEPISLQPAPTK